MSEKSDDTVKPAMAGKGAAGKKKSNSHAGLSHNVKTKPLKSVTSNQIHAAVFPNMRVPVYMRKQNDKKGRPARGVWISGSEQGLTTSSRSEEVPIMSVQCPLPGGTSVTMQTEPVQKVSWGPISRIEASDQAKYLVREFRQAVKALKNARAKRASGKNDKYKESETDGEETGKPDKSLSTPVESVTTKDGLTRETASVAYTGVSTGSVGTPNSRGFLRAPPGTPPDSIFVKAPSAAAALSMPTLPTMHQIADPALVELYRAKHAADPDAFEQETLDIKQGLIEAKVNRGGIPVLLREEYTVELACREGAEMTEKWFKGQGKDREFPGIRSRSNSLKDQPSTGSLKMRGGEIEEDTTTAAPENCKVGNSDETTTIPILELPEPHLDTKRTTKEPATTKNKSDAKRVTSPELKVHVIKTALSTLDIPANVSKITTYGTVRHQTSVKREASDHGEKRTVKTWIEITEVYHVPKPENLTLKDIAAVIEQEVENEFESDWEDDSDSDDAAGEKETDRMKKKAKGKNANKATGKASASDSDALSDSDSGSASDHESIGAADDGEAINPGPTAAESLFRSLSTLEGKGNVNAGSIDRLASDLGALMAGLRADDLLASQEEA
jgi:hypothetical protein